MLTPFLQLCYNHLTKKGEKFDEFLTLWSGEELFLTSVLDREPAYSFVVVSRVQTQIQTQTRFGVFWTRLSVSGRAPTYFWASSRGVSEHFLVGGRHCHHHCCCLGSFLNLAPPPRCRRCRRCRHRCLPRNCWCLLCRAACASLSTCKDVRK